MNLERYIGKWGSVNIGKAGIHKDDRSTYEDYPFKNQWHKCIGVDNQYLIIKFSCLTLRILKSNFRIIDPPDFLPFDKVKYISSKDKLEIGIIVAYGSKWKPKPHKVYMLEVKGKVKSTLYEKERLRLLAESTTDYKYNEKLSEKISHALKCPEYNLKLDNSGWVEMSTLITGLKQNNQEWALLRYHDILKMVDTSEKKVHEVKAERIGPKYRNEYKWYIRVSLIN